MKLLTLPTVRDRVLGVVGIVMLAGALVWAIAGGDAEPAGALLMIGLGSVVADAVVWRFADEVLAVPDGSRLPSAPWGLLVGPAGGLGLAAAVVLGVPLLAIAGGLAVVASLPGLYARFPADALPWPAVAHARRVREFARSHGVADGQSVRGYVTSLGESGVRLVVFAPDGSWADVMVRPDDVDTVTQLADVELHKSTDPDAARQLATGPRFWASMTKSW